MKILKTDTITLRINPWLKQKFEVAKWFLNVSDVLWSLIQEYVREFENQYWVINISLNRAAQYDIVTKMYWVNISKKSFEELLDIYPKERKGIAFNRFDKSKR